MEALPSNYVTLLQLKERYLKEKEKEEREQREREEEEEERVQKEKEKEERERERAEKEEKEEELRLQQLKVEEAKLRKPAGVVGVRSRGRISRPVVDRKEYRLVVDRRELRPVADRRELRPVADRRELRPVADRSVSECEGGEGEGKSEGVEEEKRWKKKKKWWWNRRKNVRAEKEGEAIEVGEESSEKEINGLRQDGGGRRRGGGEFRAKCKNELEFRGLTISGEAEIGDDRLRRPNSSNVGAKDEIKPKVRDLERNDRQRRPYRRSVGDKEEIEPKAREFGVNGETDRGIDRRRRPNGRKGGATQEIKPKVRDLVMNGETERGSDRLMGQKSEESEPKVRDLSENGETERGDRLRTPISKEESEPKVRELPMTGESQGGKGRLGRPKGNNVDGKDETGKKGMDSSVKANSERGDQMLRRPSRFDYRGNGKVWGYKNENLRHWAGLVWVKKGEVSDGNVAGVHSLEHSISGSTRASLNAKSAGSRRVINRGK